ncbi:MAG: epimerase [Candidatus Eisenbacteria bacterium]|uniref:Epimerase n=1 Tax=Eiseniibacteriota bacterium TaxID=2212470 RepID=A0A538U317_UNCEI|nr:MAG: epimerase [Candidatus Eisenbacteria bacterium]
MRFLILGGTLFLGRHVVEAALARDHDVTLFNRGRSNPALFPRVERLRGDRDGDLKALEGRRWDAVIDPSGYLPRVVRAGCELLENAVAHYTFISSINAYAERTKAGLDEDDELAELPEGAPEEVTGDTYGPYKALCEREVREAFAGRSAIVRAGLIYGPYDQTYRSSYWPLRLAEGGDVLAPGRGDRPLQLVDVRDLADWLVMLAEARTDGVFNGTGPETPLTMEAYLETCRDVAGTNANFVWVDEAFLLEQKVGPYSEMPLWVPEEFHAFEDVDVSRAIAAGLPYRRLEESVRDTLAWTRAEGPRVVDPMKLGVKIPRALSRERETELLAKWRQRAVA